MGRGATGATFGTIPLTGAAIAAASGCPRLMWALIGLSGLILLATVANRAWLLHKLPSPVGAPKPKVTFRVNGSLDPVVRLRKPAEGEPKYQPRTADIQVNVWNPARERIDRALINFLLPMGLRRKKTDGNGHRDEDGGRWMAPTPAGVRGVPGPYDYWAQDHYAFPSRSAQLLSFEATFKEPGEYPMLMRISAPALYEPDYDTDVIVRAEYGEDGPVERLTDMIAEGEQLRREMEADPDEHWSRWQKRVLAFLLRARLLVDDVLPEAKLMLSAQSPDESTGTDSRYYIALVDEDLTALYEIRRQVGRRESGEDQ